MTWLANPIGIKIRRAAAREPRVLAYIAALLIATAGITGAAARLAAVPTEFSPPVIMAISSSARRLAPAIPNRISQTSTTESALSGLMAEHRCLAEVMYYEAGGEGENGERAIAEVIFNRLADGGHGETICGVVYEGTDQTFCQFTFACDGSLSKPKSPEPWRATQVLAARLLAGELPKDNETEGATFYHSMSVHPSWAPKMVRVAQIGNHIFYRSPLSRPLYAYAAFRGPLQ